MAPALPRSPLRARRSTRRAALVPGLLAMIAAAAACDPGSDPIDPGPTPDAGPAIDPACNPLGTTACLLPWPSAAYLREADTATGVAVDLPAEAMPVNSDGVAVDPAPFNRFDGFAPSGPMLVAFPDGVSAAGLPAHEDPAASLAADAPIVVLDMDTGERVPFFAELDASATVHEDRPLIIRPLVRLRPGARHLVAIRKAVRAADGSALPVPPGFQSILAGAPLDHPRMDRLAAPYADIFAALEDAGVPRDDLVLAWDFVTASDDYLTADLLHMRAGALAAMGEDGAGLSFTAEAEDLDSPLVDQFLVGTMQAPGFLSSGEDDDSILARDADGLPLLGEDHEARFAVLVPACVQALPEEELPRPVVIFGHGLFGDGAGSVRGGGTQALANSACVVLVAGDFIGLTSRQVELAAAVVTDANLAPALTEKLAQSVIDFLALGRLARGPLAQDPRLQRGDGARILTADPDQVYYYGASLGGIMGNVIMAYSPDLGRGVLGVPGGAWSLLLERSFAWQTLQIAAQNAYPDRFAYQMLPVLLGMRFEPYDAITTAARVTGTPLPDTPVKQVLLYEAVGDSLVSNLTTEMVARTMGLSVLGPSVRLPGGLDEQGGPLGSALAIYDEQPTPLPPEDNQPPAQDNGTHVTVNTLGAVGRQVARFLLAAEIVHTCVDGDTPVPCDCTTGACD